MASITEKQPFLTTASQNPRIVSCDISGLDKALTITDLPKGSPLRTAVAQNLKTVRAMDRKCQYNNRRNGDAYMHEFKGLEYFFDHVRALDKKTVLDIGAGTTKGVDDLSRDKIADGMDLKATTLAMIPQVKWHYGSHRTGKKNVLITSAETLRHIENESIGGILALNSIAYSAVPELAIRRIDQVLVPGGIIKATFSVSSEYELFRSHELFMRELLRLGYSVAHLAENIPVVLLAIKPGGKADVSAFDLLGKDLYSYRSQRL